MRDTCIFFIFAPIDKRNKNQIKLIEMKRITRLFLTAAVVLFAGSAFAQDMTQAGELYQKATEAYQAGNEIEAVKGFKEALKIAEAAGDEGIEMVEGCKDMIPNILLSAAGKLVAAKDYAKAEETYNEALAAAKEYGKDAAIKSAETKLAQIPMQQGGDALNAGQTAEAIGFFKKAIERNPENAKAYLFMGMAENKAGNVAGAEEALLKAKELGDDKAEPTLVNIYVASANEALKAKKFNDAISAAEKALAFGENPTASLIAGNAAYQAKSWAKAANHLKNAKPSAQINYMIANSYQSAGNKGQACVYFKKILGDAKFGPTAKQKIAQLGC